MAEQTGLRNNALPYPVYGAPYGIVFPMLDADGDPVSAVTPDSEVSLNGDTFADCTNEATEIATASGIYYLLLTSAEMTADVVAIRIQDGGAAAKTTVLTLYPRKLVPLRSGTSQGGAVGYITLDASAGALNDTWNGCLCVATIDSLVEARIIDDYDGSTQQASVTPDWNVAPDADDTFILYLPEGVQLPTSNLRAISDDSTAADNLESACDNYSATRGLSGTALPAAAANAAGGLIVSTAGGQDVDTVFGRIDAAITTRSSHSAADAADAVWDEAMSGHIAAGTFGLAWNAVRANTATAGAASTITLDAGASTTTNLYSGCTITIISGTGAGQTRVITSYTSGRVASIAPSWNVNPDATSVFVIRGGGHINVASWRLSPPNTLSSGRVESAVGSMTSGVITAAAFATDSITAAAIATDAVTEIASGVWASATRTLTSPANFSSLSIDGSGRIDVGKWLGTAVTLSATSAKPEVDMFSISDSATAANNVETAGTNYSATRGLSGTALPAAAADAAGGLIISDAGGQDVDTVFGRIDVAISTVSAPSAADVADAVWDEAMSGHIASGSFGAASQAVRTNTATAGAASTITLDLGASSTTDLYTGCTITIIGGTGAGQTRIITAYNSSRVATVSPAWDVTPDATSVFAIKGGGYISVGALSGDLATDVATAVWADATATTLATNVTNILADTNELQTDWANGGRLDLIVDAILADTNELQTDWANGGRLDLILDAALAGLTSGSLVVGTVNDGAIGAAAVTDIFSTQTTIDGKTVQQALQYIAAAVAGKLSGAGTGTETVVGLDGTTNRIEATVDISGNRTAMTYDP